MKDYIVTLRVKPDEDTLNNSSHMGFQAELTKHLCSAIGNRQIAGWEFIQDCTVLDIQEAK